MNEVLDYISELVKKYTNIKKVYISSIKDFGEDLIEPTCEIQIFNTTNERSFYKVLWTDLELNIVFRSKQENNNIEDLEKLNNLFLKTKHLKNYSIIQIMSDSIKFEDIDEKLNYIYTIGMQVKYNKK